ncbi:MAG: PTS fructose transporter subunit IIA [Proteobacteria bacterium]|jgi:mannose PTS system EIIA component|nr:PTS fructose transporter subunit IIA [Pseudomonadota bacterium]
MIGMVLVTHGGLAAEFVAALEHIVEAKVDHVAIVPIGPEDDMEQRRYELLERVKEVDDGAGVVVLTDMFGGTPSNLAISILEAANVEVIAGVNLPMLIRLHKVRSTKSLLEAAEAAQEAGRNNINIASSLLATRTG